MAKHLSREDVEAILNIIQTWSDKKMNWEDICSKSAQVVGKKPTRQSLNANKAIVNAYKVKKASLKLYEPAAPMPNCLSMAADRISRLLGENQALKRENSRLLEQFIIWQYNTYKYGMKEHQLNLETSSQPSGDNITK